LRRTSSESLLPVYHALHSTTMQTEEYDTDAVFRSGTMLKRLNRSSCNQSFVVTEGPYISVPNILEKFQRVTLNRVPNIGGVAKSYLIFILLWYGAEYCDECVHVCLCVSLSLTYFSNHISRLHQISVYPLPAVTARSFSAGVLNCDTLCTSGFVDDVMFPYGAGDTSTVGCKLRMTQPVGSMDLTPRAAYTQTDLRGAEFDLYTFPC